MSQRIARFLLGVAARRWPAELRDELRQEWSAELYVLAEQRRHARMVRYAASLAMARPARRSTPVAGATPVAARVGRLVLAAPLLTVALLIGSLVAMNIVVGLLPSSAPFGIDPQLPLLTLFTLASAVLLVRLGRKWTVSGAPATLILAVTVPGFALAVLANAALGGSEKVEAHAPAYAVFFAGLGGIMAAVTRLASAGRGRAAWWTGILGAVVVADIAVMLPVLSDNTVAEETPHPASAPLWLFTALTDSGFGLPGLNGMQVFIIGDAVELDPLLYLVFTAFALGAVIAGARPSLRDQGVPEVVRTT